MCRYIILFSFLFVFNSTLIAQSKYTISGYIRDKQDGESLIGASVVVKELSGTGTVTNAYGYYSISLPPGEYSLLYSYIGYSSQASSISLNQNISLNMELSSENVELSEVVVTGNAIDPVTSVEMSVNRLDISTIQKVPALLGEVDVIRSILLLPGVTTVGEGASGFNVRGGSIDQNLVLLDEAPVYNSSHLLGFFSVFNPDAVKDVKLVKGGIPAKYGGRLSSLLDVRMKEGNSKRFSGTGGLGLIFSRLTLEAPIIKDKSSFIIAGRRSYGDLFLKLSPDEDLKNSRLYFYDLSGKVNLEVNDKNKIYLSGYFGRDVFSVSDQFGFNWGNSTATFRWNRLFSQRLFSNVTAFYSNYDYRIGTLQGGESDGANRFDWKSNIINYSIKPEFNFYLNTNNTISFGGQGILYNFKPGTANIKSRGEGITFKVPDKYSFESAVYVDNEQKVNTRLSLNYGLRYAMFNYLGPGSAFAYNDTIPGIRKRRISEQKYEDGENIKTYTSLEPRISLRYSLNTTSSIKASYQRTSQFIHLISNTAASTPLDVWTPSTNNLAPQFSDQVAAGYFLNLGKWYELSVESFYKTMQNQIDYIDGADLLLNQDLEADLLTGEGRAYGMELYFKKNTGSLTGWVSYTLARTERKVIGVNMNNWYPSRFDKTHNLVLVGIYEINKKWDVSANFVYGTGTPVTFPTNRYMIQDIIIPHNYQEGRNNYRLPAYHRLDLSVTINGRKREKWEDSFVISLYNVYARRNPFNIYFRQNEENPINTEAVRLSVFGTIIPGFTYNFKF